MRYLLTACLVATLAAPITAQAATLQDAIAHWTGVTTDVEGSGETVRVVLPRGGPVPSLTMRAVATRRGDEAGWQLSDILLPSPLHLSGGGTAQAATQHGTSWLGSSTATLNTSYTGINIVNDGVHTSLDRARMDMVATAGPVSLDMELAGLHSPDAEPDVARLLPRHVVVRGHTTQAGAAAMVAMFGGLPAGAAPVTIDALSFDVGPAQFSGTGTIVIRGPHDRRGQVQITATNFKELMQGMPGDGKLAKFYPAMMVLRSMAEKQDGRLVWVAAFEGPQILVNGIDIAPLIGL